MAHQRVRLAQSRILKMSRLWPVLGVVGARQSGKTTLVTKQINVGSSVSFDDEDLREEALAHPKAFLEKYGSPLLIDEVQKVPSIFDAIKYRVDKKRVPGSYYLTGSTQFSEKVGIYESLTGRIGLMQLYPLNLAETFEEGLPKWKKLLGHTEIRFTPGQLAKYSIQGGMPVPLFLRDPVQREAYWQGWLETTINRDLYRVYGGGYQPEIASKILAEFGSIFLQGEIPTVSRFTLASRKLNKYLKAMETIFLIRRIPMHPSGTGLDGWLMLDSGLCGYLMKQHKGTGPSLSLIRHAVWNELLSNYEYRFSPYRPFYYKSAKGTPIDWVDDEHKAAFKIILEGRGNGHTLAYSERALAGAMKTFKLSRGFLVCPIEKPEIPKKAGIGLLPWTYWS